MKTKLMLRLKQDILRSYKHFSKMTFQQKRTLLQLVFAGKDADGKRYGVFINKTKNGKWGYTIKGIFQDLKGSLREINLFNRIDLKSNDFDEYNNLISLENNMKQNISGQDQGYFVYQGIIPFKLNGNLKIHKIKNPHRFIPDEDFLLSNKETRI